MSAIAYRTEEAFIISAQIYLYGGFADQTMAVAIEDEINQMWNAPDVVHPQWQLPVRFDIRVSVRENVRTLMKTNTSYEVNFVRIEEKNIYERSMMGLGQNSGHWLMSDDLGKSTTAAHEFGHALGLRHPHQLDYRGLGFPPIMAPRGTLVDAQYQWNPLADVGAFGGTMKPIHRKVWKEEVLQVIARAQHNGFNYTIGEISNYYFDELGNAFYP
jgi:hypothetical protein